MINLVVEKAKQAKEAARSLAYISTNTKNNALLAMADSLLKNTYSILEANEEDERNAARNQLSSALIDRLMLNQSRIADMANGLAAIASLPDPVGEVESMWTRPNGLRIGKMRVPLGVVGIIYESRPNVTADAAGLCVKTGNAALLRGGSEAIYSNLAIAQVIGEAAIREGLPSGSISFIETTDREAVNDMLKLTEYIDVLIPRGGSGLIQTVVQNATVPVIETGVGNCHAFVDRYADLVKAQQIVLNAKCQRPGVCNALESLLVDSAVADKFLPEMLEALKAVGVEVRGCERVCALADWVIPATEEDYAAEFLDLIISVKVVDDLDDALDHIYHYSTKHSETIITEDYTRAMRFLNEVDAAAVYINASTRFTDGGEFGFGAEIGISTQKLHARGPMGLKELTTNKYILFGNGQIRE